MPKTVILTEYGVDAKRKNAIIAEYPRPDYTVQVSPLGGGRYNVIVFEN